MSKLQELKNKLSPNGIEFRKLGEIGTFYGGLSGKNKYDFINGNAKFISYKNVFNNIEIDLNINDTVKVNETEAQNTIKYADILFTGSSETLEESGISSVVTFEPQENYYLNSFCFGLRFFDNIKILPNFAKYLFRCSNIRKQIIKCSQGVTRYNLSKKKMESIEIPIPPLKVQEEIIRILDPLTKDVNELIDLLKREQDLRKKQYAYYRDKLLTFEEDSLKKRFRDTCIIKSGEFASPKELSKIQDDLHIYPCYGSNGLRGYINKFNYDGEYPIVGRVGALCGSVNYVSGKFFVTDNALIVQSKGEYIPRFLYYLLISLNLNKYKAGGAQPAIAGKTIYDLSAPLPPLEKQKEIVSILDNLEKYYNNLQESLTVEIEKRKKQYEFYRDKLLTFEKI